MADRFVVAGEVLPYSVKSGPWESVECEWIGIPMRSVVMIGNSRRGVHVDTGAGAML